MKRATITYDDERVLRAIAAMGRELGFSVEPPEEGVEYINGVQVIKGGGLTMQDIEEMSDIFTAAKLDARELRRAAWGKR